MTTIVSQMDETLVFLQTNVLFQRIHKTFLYVFLNTLGISNPECTGIIICTYGQIHLKPFMPAYPSYNFSYQTDLLFILCTICINFSNVSPLYIYIHYHRVFQMKNILFYLILFFILPVVFSVVYVANNLKYSKAIPINYLMQISMF